VKYGALRAPTLRYRGRSPKSCGPLGISVHDHLTVGKDGHASLKALKLM
jgi:DNA repair protein RadC